ncbi:MAG: GNAT family N-acetyltransferase [Cyanobacteriota bacterium]|nr:GNAT family N-acetyltransferase [Cyanobacteriota bacterium]
MATSWTIRPAQPADRPTLVQFMAGLQDAERQLHPNRPAGAEIADAHFRYLETLVQEQQGGIYVAEVAGSLVGFVLGYIDRLDERSLYVIKSEQTYGYISELYVVPEMRQQGVGVALLARAEQHFLDRGLALIRVGSLCNNQVANQLYQKVGYQPYEMLFEKRVDKGSLSQL